MPEAAANLAPPAPQSNIYDAASDPRVADHDAMIESRLASYNKPAAPSTPAPNPPAAAAAPVSKHPAILQLKARKLGLDPAEIETIDSNELKELLTDIVLMGAETRMTGSVSHPPAAGLNGQVPEPVGAAPNPAAPAAAPAVDPRAELAKGLKAVVDDDVASAIISYFDGCMAILNPRLEAIEGTVKDTVPFVQKQKAAAEDAQIDAGFADLGPAFRRILGEGPYASIDKKSGQFRCRVSIVKAMNANPPADGNLRKAIFDIGRQMYGHMADDVTEAPGEEEEVAPAQRHNVRDPINKRFTAADYQRAALAAPTGRANPPLPPGTARAVAGVKQALSRYAEDGGDELNQGEDKFL